MKVVDDCDLYVCRLQGASPLTRGAHAPRLPHRRKEEEQRVPGIRKKCLRMVRKGG